MPLWCLFTFVVFYGIRLYHSIWTYFSLDEAITVVKAYLVLTLLYVVSSLILHMRMPMYFYILRYFYCFVLHVCIRFSYRILRGFVKTTETRNRRAEDKKSHNVMIIGAGEQEASL